MVLVAARVGPRAYGGAHSARNAACLVRVRIRIRVRVRVKIEIGVRVRVRVRVMNADCLEI